MILSLFMIVSNLVVSDMRQKIKPLNSFFVNQQLTSMHVYATSCKMRNLILHVISSHEVFHLSPYHCKVTEASGLQRKLFCSTM